jgi:protein phosphatase
MLISFAMLPGEVLLLCSDGLTDYAAGTHAEMGLLIEEAARSANIGGACRRLVDRANENGGGDNITVILARTVHN